MELSPWFQMIATIICSILASSGFWAYLQKKYEKKIEEIGYSTAETQMIIGLAHDRITSLGLTYIERGDISQDEYENLHDYLFKPYSLLGGNGSAKRIMKEVDKLPIRKTGK